MENRQKSREKQREYVNQNLNRKAGHIAAAGSYAADGSQIARAAHSSGRNSTAVALPKANPIANISAEDHRGGDKITGTRRTMGAASEHPKIHNNKSIQLTRERPVLHAAATSAPDSKQPSACRAASDFKHKTNSISAQSQHAGYGHPTTDGKVKNGGTQSSDGGSATQHDPMMFHYSSNYKTSLHLPTTGSGNVGTSQGKEGLAAAGDSRLADGDLAGDAGVIITQFIPQIPKMPSPSPRNGQSVSQERHSIGKHSLALGRQPSSGQDSRTYKSSAQSSVHSNILKQATPVTGAAGGAGQYSAGQKAIKGQMGYSENRVTQTGLHTQRNYSGSLHKAPSGPSYPTQRTVQIAKHQKISKNLITATASTNHHVSNHGRVQQQLSGTAGSDSTGISRSGGATHGSGSLANGIPIHPRMVKQKTASGALGITGSTRLSQGARLSNGGESAAHYPQQQTPGISMSDMNHRHRQFYSSKQNAAHNDSQGLGSKEAAGAADKSNMTAGLSSQCSQQKIQKFDFTHYDGQIEEQLRIPKQKTETADQKVRPNTSSSSSQAGTSDPATQRPHLTSRGRASIRLQTNNDNDKMESQKNDCEELDNTARKTPDLTLMAQQAKDAEKSYQNGSSADDDNRTPSQNFNHILPIDQQKMRQLQEGILQVRVGMGMMGQAPSGSNTSGSARPSEQKQENLKTRRAIASQQTESEIVKNQDQEAPGNDSKKHSERGLLKAYQSAHPTQSRDKRYSSTHAVIIGRDSSRAAETERNRQSPSQGESTRLLNTIVVDQNHESKNEKLSLEQIIQQNQKIKSKYSNPHLESSRSAQDLPSASKSGSHKVINTERESNRSGKSSGPSKASAGKPPVKSGVKLQITIPDDNEERSVEQQSNQKSDDSQNLQPGEENLAPSTEKKNDKKQLNPNNIPKTGTHFGQTISSKNIFLNKFQSNSTRNTANLRYQNVDSKANRGGKFDFGDIDDLENGNGDENGRSDSKAEAKIEQKRDANALKPMAQISAERGSSHGRLSAITGAGISGLAANAVQRLASVKSQFLQTSSQANEKPQIKQLGHRSGSTTNVSAQHTYGSVNQNQSNAPGGMDQGSAGLKTIDAAHQDPRFNIQPAHKIIIPNDEPTKTSNKANGVVRAYAANTNQGLVRNYNEDRVSIITSLMPPKTRKDIDPQKWPRCSYFGIYDGHGGSLCADFLRDNLHHFVISETCFPQNPKEAIVRGFEKAEKAFMDKIYNPATNELKDKSGSCAIVVLIVQDMCYVANVGDSRAVLSCEEGRRAYPLSLDHKPGEDGETERIKQGGGEIYYRTATNQIITYEKEKMNKYQQFNLAGPLRVLPGRLSVARTFGDPEAKILALNGNPNVVIHNPDVKSFQIKREHDFIMLGCDGIFDKMSNSDSVQCVWRAAHDNKYHPSVKNQAQDVHKMCGMGIEYILKNSLLRRSLDNVTAVIIAFSNFKHAVFGHSQQQKQPNSENDEQVQKADAPKRDEESNCINAQATLQNQNSHGALQQQTQPKLQKEYGNKRTFERTKSANLPKYQLNHQQQQREYIAQKVRNENKNDHQKMNTATHSHIGASKSSISTMSTIGNGATNADGATKTIKNSSNIENDDPNYPAEDPSVSKSKEQPQDEGRLQQLLHLQSQIADQVKPYPYQQVKSARLSSYYSNGMKPPIASSKASIGVDSNNHANQKHSLKAARASLQDEAGSKAAYRTAAGAASGTLTSSHTHQNLHQFRSGMPNMAAPQQQLKHKNVQSFHVGSRGFSGENRTQPDSRPVQIRESNPKGSSRSLVKMQQKMERYNQATEGRPVSSSGTGAVKMLAHVQNQNEIANKQQKIVQINKESTDNL